MSKQSYLEQFSLPKVRNLVLFEKILSGATIPSQSGSGRDGNEGLLHIPKAPASLKPQDQIVKCHILYTCWWVLTALQRCSRSIIQPQPTGQKDYEKCKQPYPGFEHRVHFKDHNYYTTTRCKTFWCDLSWRVKNILPMKD